MIKIKNIYKKYDNTEVLNGLNLEVNESEILVILGKSGAGKSVLLKQIIGLEKPDKGTIEINGTEITDLSEKEFFKFVMHMGMLFQSSALFDSLNIENNVGFYLHQNPDPATNQYLSKKEIKDRVIEALKMVGLENSAEKMPSDLSGGMKKKSCISSINSI